MKNSPAMQETQVGSLAWEDPLEKGMATHSSILAWRLPWTVEPGRLQSILDTTEQLTFSFSFLLVWNMIIMLFEILLKKKKIK